jgi:hypothetical protein
MATVLVVANETLASRTLVEWMRERHEKGDAEFVLVAPMARPSSGFVSYDDVLRDAAQHRIDSTVAELGRLGISARGEVMDPDPFSAVSDAVGMFAPSEIVISTHPETRSGWLRRDLIERARQSWNIPVEHVVVDLESERGDATNTLVVASQTAGGRPLVGLLKGKAEEKPHRFAIVVPLQGRDETVESGRRRLREILDTLRAEDIDATGHIGDPDPYTAVMNALSFYKVDEIVISTHPVTRSGWLRSDLVERVRRSTSVPVEHIVVDLDAGQTAA